MATHIIYHQVKPHIDCPDGIVAASIAYKYHSSIGEVVTVSGACYRKEYPGFPDFDIPSGTKKIVIADFSYPASWIHFWESQGAIVTIIEHHADKFPWLENFSGAVLDDKECGATLAWKFYYPEWEMPPILDHVRRRDIGLDGYYRGESPRSEAVNMGFGEMRSTLKDRTVIEKVEKIAAVIFGSSAWVQIFEERGISKIQTRDALIADRLTKSSITELNGITCAFYDFTNDPEIAPHYSMLGSKLCTHHGVKLAWLIDGKSNHLRSLDPSTDCATIAKQYGGGGHPCASGWQS